MTDIFTCGVRFTFNGRLADHLTQKRRDTGTHSPLRLPGVVIAQDGTKMWVPECCVRTVVEVLRSFGITDNDYWTDYQDVPPWEPVEAWEHARDILEARGEAHPWLWADTPPTTAEPIRLFGYQREGIGWGVHVGDAAFWAPTGAGKTWMGALWGLAVCTGPILEVTPSPQARAKHALEVARISTLQPYNWKGESLVRKRDRWHSLEEYLAWCEENETRPYVLTSWTSLIERQREIIDVLRPEAVIWDELHRSKSDQRNQWIPGRRGGIEKRRRSNITGSAANIAEAVSYRLGTTASPVDNRLKDLWGQMSLIRPWAWGQSSTEFIYRYCRGVPGEYGGVEARGLSHVDELKHRLNFSVWLVSQKRTHSELPPKRREVLWIEPEEQVKAFKWTAAERKQAEGADRHRVTQMRIHEAASRKRPVIIRDIAEWLRGQPQAKMLVFTGRRVDAEELARQLQNKLPDVTIKCGHGGHPIEDRIAIEREYMGDPEKGTGPHPGPYIIVGTQAAWGESLDLQDSDLLINVTLPWTPKMVVQVEGRGHRPGMSRPFLVRYYVARGTYDERVAELLIDKLPAVEAMTGDDLDGLEVHLEDLPDNLDALSEVYA